MGKPSKQSDFIIGHFIRAVPDFVDQIKDKNLREYYQKLSILIHSENLFSRERLLTICRFNTGYYDYLLNAYLADTATRRPPFQ
jgi:arabinofuranosyltransferase